MKLLQGQVEMKPMTLLQEQVKQRPMRLVQDQVAMKQPMKLLHDRMKEVNRDVRRSILLCYQLNTR